MSHWHDLEWSSLLLYLFGHQAVPHRTPRADKSHSLCQEISWKKVSDLLKDNHLLMHCKASVSGNSLLLFWKKERNILKYEHFGKIKRYLEKKMMLNTQTRLIWYMYVCECVCVCTGLGGYAEFTVWTWSMSPNQLDVNISFMAIQYKY